MRAAARLRRRRRSEVQGRSHPPPAYPSLCRNFAHLLLLCIVNSYNTVIPWIAHQKDASRGLRTTWMRHARTVGPTSRLKPLPHLRDAQRAVSIVVQTTPAAATPRPQARPTATPVCTAPFRAPPHSGAGLRWWQRSSWRRSSMRRRRALPRRVAGAPGTAALAPALPPTAAFSYASPHPCSPFPAPLDR